MKITISIEGKNEQSSDHHVFSINSDGLNGLQNLTNKLRSIRPDVAGDSDGLVLGKLIETIVKENIRGE